MVSSAQKILIVEDEPDVVDLLVRQLNRTGQFRSIVANDGEIGIRLARTESPALIVLDLMRPKIGGLEVCRVLKSDSATRSIPIVMLTSRDNMLSQLRGRMAGATEYLTKPFDSVELVQTVKKHLANWQQRAPAPPQNVRPRLRSRV